MRAVKARYRPARAGIAGTLSLPSESPSERLSKGFLELNLYRAPANLQYNDTDLTSDQTYLNDVQVVLLGCTALELQQCLLMGANANARSTLSSYLKPQFFGTFAGP